MAKPLPAGSQTFHKIIEGGFLYVDKTQYLYELVHSGLEIYCTHQPNPSTKNGAVYHELGQVCDVLRRASWTLYTIRDTAENGKNEGAHDNPPCNFSQSTDPGHSGRYHDSHSAG